MMKIGLCSYNFVRALSSGALSVEDMFRTLRDWGASHVEISDFTLPVYEGDMPARLKEWSEKYGIEIAGLNFGSDIANLTGDAYKEELEKLYQKLDVAHQIGATSSRIDMVRQIGKWRGDQTKIDLIHWADGTIVGGTEDFEKVFEGIVRAAKDLCDYNAQYGNPVLSENHGILFNGADRMKRVYLAVDKKNYGITMDVGNALCVGEDPLVMVEELLPIVRRVHFKDFYVRGAEEALAIGTEDSEGNRLKEEGTIAYSGWLTSRYGDYLRGAIVGQGDVPVQLIVDKLLDYGYDGYLSVEFEGIEDCFLGSKLGLRTLKNLVG
ncbi:MAG: sugar phosphate isomerase/epimerase [Firmicutes bacterium]|nr:sugar phosphate isomerase/epimerase [Bacillota bacterium]